MWNSELLSVKWFGFLFSLLVCRLCVDHWGSKCGYNRVMFATYRACIAPYAWICFGQWSTSYSAQDSGFRKAVMRESLGIKVDLQIEVWKSASRCMMRFHSACVSLLHVYTGHTGVCCMLCYNRFSAVLQLVHQGEAGQRGLKGEKGERVRISNLFTITDLHLAIRKKAQLSFTAQTCRD